MVAAASHPELLGMCAAEEGIIPDKGIADERLEKHMGMERTSMAKDMAMSDRGGREFLHAVESTRAIKVHCSSGGLLISLAWSLQMLNCMASQHGCQSSLHQRALTSAAVFPS